ncbi:uncharacterized protein LOC122303032 isoform X2 [Carya illinoinensis]|uniref:uncharacterized protein LOC122303032 isoform X2 n=1 Tax=Carya illinoinensis TaxID=32201 RepID=UPI001C725DFD|nr:uncharacterized protein LOC122303032 isoform X2 [Carya illinoinensis]
MAPPSTKTNTLGNPRPATRSTKRKLGESLGPTQRSRGFVHVVKNRSIGSAATASTSPSPSRPNGCAKEQNVCAKCRCRVNRIVGRDSSEVEAEQKSLDEAIKNARERDRRTLLRAMNRDESKSSAKMATSKENKVGELFPSASLEEYAELRRDDNGDEDDNEDEDLILS